MFGNTAKPLPDPPPPPDPYKPPSREPYKPILPLVEVTLAWDCFICEDNPKDFELERLIAKCSREKIVLELCEEHIAGLNSKARVLRI